MSTYINWCSFVLCILVVTSWITRLLAVQYTFHLITWRGMCLYLTSASSSMLWLKQLDMRLFSRKLLTTWKHLRYSMLHIFSVCMSAKPSLLCSINNTGWAKKLTSFKKFIIFVCDDVGMRWIYQNVQLFVRSNTDILSVAIFKYSSHTFSKTTLHWKYQLI